MIAKQAVWDVRMIIDRQSQQQNGILEIRNNYRGCQNEDATVWLS